MAWLKQTAREMPQNLISEFLNRETPLVFRDRDGDEVEMDIAAPESGTQSVLFAGLLDNVLDSALIEGSESPEGYLKKLAFQMYYIDGLPMREITAHMTRYRMLGQTGKAINQTTINNWLSRGDILKLVVRYLKICHRKRGKSRALDQRYDDKNNRADGSGTGGPKRVARRRTEFVRRTRRASARRRRPDSERRQREGSGASCGGD